MSGCLAVPAAALSVALEPIQSGTGDPSPTNIRPISGRTEVNVGRTGKNQLQITATTATVNGVTFTVNDDGTVTVDGLASAQANFVLHTGFSYAGDVILNGNIVSSDILLNVQGVGSDTGSGLSYNATTARTIQIVVLNGKRVDNVTIKPMIRPSSVSDPTFEPYTPVTLTIALGQTVYGGNLDVKTGALTITHAIIDLGDLTWALISGLAHSFRAVVSGKKNATSASVVDDIICTCYKTVTGMEATTLDDVIGGSTGNSYIYITDSDYDDPTSFKTFVTGQKIVYALDTPATVQLTPAQLMMLKGYNSLSTDGGDVITVTAYVKTTT